MDSEILRERLPVLWGASVDVNSPFFVDAEFLEMRRQCEIMTAAIEGTEYLRQEANAAIHLPLEPREKKDSWRKRLGRSVLAPFVKRLITNASALVFRKPIQLEGGDSWWKEEFIRNVDGEGSSLDEFAKKRFEIALSYGMSSLVVDCQRKIDKEASPRPYFVPVDPWQYLGFEREEGGRPGADLLTFRYQEILKRKKGKYGSEHIRIARVITRGAFDVYEERSDEPIDSGELALPYVPVVTFYAERDGFMIASPPLSDVAHLNIAHFQRLADLQHSLHTAAIGMLVLEDYEEKEAVTGLSYAVRMDRGAKAYWVLCDSGSFAAQSELLDRLETQISSLGITKLLGQRLVAESEGAKRIEQQQANCVLSSAAQNLQDSLNDALRMAAEYRGVEPPVAHVNKDFDMYRLIGQDVSVLKDMQLNGQISKGLFLKMLQDGDWIPSDVDVDGLAREPGQGQEAPSAAAPETGKGAI